MALPSYTETRYRIWHYIYLTICTFIFIYLIAPLFVIFPLSFSHDEFLIFSEEMKSLDPDGFSTRWYKDMVWGTKNPWGLAAKNSLFIAFFATIGSVSASVAFVDSCSVICFSTPISTNVPAESCGAVSVATGAASAWAS